MPTKIFHPLKPARLSFYLAGTSSGGVRTFDGGQVNAPVTLMKEPLNNYDHMAIAVYLDGIKIGFVPRPTNEWVWFLVETGRFKITEWDLDNNDHVDYPLVQVTYEPS